ncbi:hypothetical protein LIER_22800 [Lithospermum erythrorhizon]|uniref:Bidirectional sugar transporter SWEET n=1 Tax=Lithospermum erythrorhizon TaxID=34254 RepID=A0AAV3QY99_LITER
MERLSFLVGIIGNIISVLMFLAPAKTFWRIVKRRSTEEFDSFPYIATLLNSSLWTYYGIIRPNSYLVATVNGFGVAVEIVYITLFLVFACQKMRVRTSTLVALLDVGFLAIVVVATQFTMIDAATRINVIGFLSSGLNIIMYGSPLAAMKGVLTTRSVEYMPFLLSFFFFLNGGIWTFYALLVHDWFLGLPNGIGFVLGIIQLVIYAIYRPHQSSHKLNNLEEGTQREQLLPSSSDLVQ